MQYSHSKVECYKKCPYRYKLRYVDGLRTLDDYEASNPLHVGTCLHEAIVDKEQAFKNYYAKYPIVTEQHFVETYKIEKMLPKVQRLLGDGQFEYKLENNDFVGYIDYIDDKCIYDFKYSNSDYSESSQLHLYRYFYGQNKKLAYIMIPKVGVKRKWDEPINDYYKRVDDMLEGLEPMIVDVEYDADKVIETMLTIKHIQEAIDFPKNETKLCYFCEFNDFCKKGQDYMLLPKNERRQLNKINKKAIWIYGSPFSGKTWFANTFPNPLMLNNDGNIKFVDAPYLSIVDTLEVEGRQKKIKYGWEKFKDIVEELDTTEHEFETIIVDVLDELYESCRRCIRADLGISHESDDSFKSYDIIRNEFLSHLKRLMQLDVNVVLISHEDATKDIFKKSGEKFTSIKPAIADKVANKISGMVDIVARVIADEDERLLSFKSSDIIFGGGRLKVKGQDIPLTYEALCEVYSNNNIGLQEPKNFSENVVKEQQVETVEEQQVEEQQEETVEEPKTTRKRRRRE